MTLSSCTVCRTPKNGDNVFEDGVEYQLPVSNSFARDKITDWLAASNKRQPEVSRSTKARLTRKKKSFPLCDTCLSMVSEIDRLEWQLAKKIDELWRVADSDPSTSEIKQEKERVEPSNRLLEMAVEEIFKCEDYLLENEASSDGEPQKSSKRTRKENADEDFVPNTKKKRRVIVRKNVSSLLTKTEETSLNCDLCEKHFSSQKLLKVHKKFVHFDTRPKIYSCLNCNEEFPTARKLQVHRRRHDGVLCPVCGKSFRQDGLNSNAVADHIAAIHKGEKNYRCEVCGEKFGYLRNLAKHRRHFHGINSKFDLKYI